MQYFDLHVFHSRRDGFSVPVAIPHRSLNESYDDDDMIGLSVQLGLLDEEEAMYVDSVDEITEDEYNDMKGI